MSLMKLLSAGRSWVGLKDPGSRYQMGKPGMLPKFGSGRNPFGAKNAAHQSDSSDRSDKVAAPTPVPGGSQAQVRPASHSRSQIANSQEVAKKGNWASKLGVMLGLRVKKRGAAAPARAAGPRPETRPQLELSLDKIRVVRNDLSDADVVILTAEEPPVESGEYAGRTARGKRAGAGTLSAQPVEVSNVSRT
jgi:hypothetical protein